MLKRRLTLESSLRIVTLSLCQKWCHGKVDGRKKKVMGKERRSKNKRFVEKVETYQELETCSIFNPAHFRKKGTLEMSHFY
jgi:hypothetical protein